MKRALSFILALTLALTLLPTFASATTAETTEPEYSWTPVVFNLGAPTTLKFKAQDETETPHEYTNGNQYSYGATVEGENWKFVMSRQRSDIMYKGKSIKTVKHATYGNYLQISAPVTVTDSETNEVKTYSQYTFALKVPASGIYDISADVFNTSGGVKIEAVIHDQKKIDRDPAEKISIGQINNTYDDSDEISLPDKDASTGPRTRVFSNGIGVPVAKTENWDTATNEAFIDTAIILNGIMVKEAKNSNTLYNFTFTPSRINSATVTVPANEYEINATFTPSVSLNLEGAGDKIYSDLAQAGITLGVKEADAGVTVANNVYTVAESGEITFTPTVTVNGKTHEAASVTITVSAPVEDPDLTDAFDDAKTEDAPSDYIAPTVDSIDATGIVGTPELQADGSYKITAPETNEDGEEFLYWKKAMTTNEKIVSLVREFNYVPEEKGRNILVAVYEGDITSTSPKCYNANGQYLPDATPVIEDLPSMAGYGKAYKWEQYKNTNVYVAQYEAETPIAGLNVHITGGNGDNTNAAYGDPIICTTSDAHKEKYGAYFKYWKRVDTDGTETILSRNEEYSFKAWESCEIEGVYSADPVNYNGPTRKILIDSFAAGEEIGVMAEFLGFGGNVVEKGIMFNGNRIAMTTVGNQFSVIADKPGTYVGYAIVEETDGLKLITDGSYTKSAN